MPEGMKNVLWCGYLESVHGQENVAKILNGATQIANGYENWHNPDDVELDWLEKFREIAKRTNDDEKQLLMSKILNGELKSPGLLSKRTLDVIDSLSRGDADVLMLFFSYSFVLEAIPEDEEHICFVEPQDSEVFSRELLVRLEEMGVTASSIHENCKIPRDGRDILVAKGKKIHIDNEYSALAGFVSFHPLTSIGREIATFCPIGTVKINWKERVEEMIDHPLSERYDLSFPFYLNCF